MPLFNGAKSDRRIEQAIKCSAAPFFPSKKWIKLIPKTIGKRKRLCVRLHSGDKHHLRKSADCKAQIRKPSVSVTGLSCALWSAHFLRWCLSPSATSHTISFSISNSFGINNHTDGTTCTICEINFVHWFAAYKFTYPRQDEKQLWF